MTLSLCPVSREEAQLFVRRHHRHAGCPPGDVFRVGVQSESGSSLRAAGYKIIGERPDENWNRPGRPRVERNTGPKFKWEAAP